MNKETKKQLSDARLLELAQKKAAEKMDAQRANLLFATQVSHWGLWSFFMAFTVTGLSWTGMILVALGLGGSMFVLKVDDGEEDDKKDK